MTTGTEAGHVASWGGRAVCYAVCMLQHIHALPDDHIRMKAMGRMCACPDGEKEERWSQAELLSGDPVGQALCYICVYILRSLPDTDMSLTLRLE